MYKHNLIHGLINNIETNRMMFFYSSKENLNFYGKEQFATTALIYWIGKYL